MNEFVTTFAAGLAVHRDAATWGARHFQRPGAAVRAKLLAFAGAIVLSLSACGGKIPGVYRIDIQQGNVLTQEQLAQLEPGMERRKVRFILGTPLLTDAFNQDRWDYYYSFEEGSGDKVQRRVSVYFDDDRLVRLDGDVTRADGPIEVPPRKEEMVKVPEGLVSDGLFAGFVPDFLSDRPRLLRPRDSEEEKEQIEGPAPDAAAPTDVEPSEPDAPAVTVSEAETSELADVLGGFGARGSDDTISTQSASVSEGDSGETDGEEGVVRRWAERLGFGGDDDGDAPSVPPDYRESER